MQIELEWQGGERFAGAADGTELVLDGQVEASDALSPMQAVAAGLAGCMAIDIAAILEKGRQPLERLEVRLSAERAERPPRRFVRFRMEVTVNPEVERAKVERAIALSRETYCSVWHSLRPEVPFEIELSQQI